MKQCNTCNKSQEYIEYHKHSATRDGYRNKCKTCIKTYMKTSEYKLKRANYLKSNKDNIRIKKREYKNKLKQSNPFYATKVRLRKRIYRAFTVRNWNKNNTTKEILGCEFEEAFNHIESQFIDNMSWDNRTEWHIDHIIPLSSAKTEKDLIKLCHYTNLQPLWAIDNLKKSNKH